MKLRIIIAIMALLAIITTLLGSYLFYISKKEGTTRESYAYSGNYIKKAAIGRIDSHLPELQASTGSLATTYEKKTSLSLLKSLGYLLLSICLSIGIFVYFLYRSAAVEIEQRKCD